MRLKQKKVSIIAKYLMLQITKKLKNLRHQICIRNL